MAEPTRDTTETISKMAKEHSYTKTDLSSPVTSKTVFIMAKALNIDHVGIPLSQAIGKKTNLQANVIH